MSTPPNYGGPPAYQNEEFARALELDKGGYLRSRVSEQAPGMSFLFGAQFGGVNNSNQPNWFSNAKPLTDDEERSARLLGYKLDEIRNPAWFTPSLGLASAFERGQYLNDPAIGKNRLEFTLAQSAAKTNQAKESRQYAFQERDREDTQKFNLNLNTQNLDARAREVQEQGKLNMRQSMIDSVNQRRLASINNPTRILV